MTPGVLCEARKNAHWSETRAANVSLDPGRLAGAQTADGTTIDDVRGWLSSQMAVEPSLACIARRLGECLDDRRDLLGAERARDRQLDAPAWQEEVAGGGDRRWTDRLLAAAHVRVGDPAAMPDLADYPAARGVDRVGDLAPSGDLILPVNTWAADDPVPLVGDLGAFGHDQTRGGALDVVVPHPLGRDAVLAGARAGHRRHDDAIGKREIAQLKGRE